VRHVHDLTLTNIHFDLAKNDARPILIADDVEELEVNDFRAPAAQGPEAARFTNVKTLRLQNAPVLQTKAGRP
jgi:hypothetical protein